MTSDRMCHRLRIRASAPCQPPDGGRCADSFVLPSNREVLSPTGMSRRMVEVNGRQVEVWTTRSPGAVHREPTAYVLFFVGNADRAERWLSVVADGWDQRPVEAWGMNYPGSGGSDGPARLASIRPTRWASMTRCGKSRARDLFSFMLRAWGRLPRVRGGATAGRRAGAPQPAAVAATHPRALRVVESLVAGDSRLGTDSQ